MIRKYARTVSYTLHQMKGGDYRTIGTNTHQCSDVYSTNETDNNHQKTGYQCLGCHSRMYCFKKSYNCRVLQNKQEEKNKRRRREEQETKKRRTRE